MPIFEYRCKHCKNEEEVITTIKPPNTKQCKKCGNRMLRVFSAHANMASRWVV